MREVGQNWGERSYLAWEYEVFATYSVISTKIIRTAFQDWVYLYALPQRRPQVSPTSGTGLDKLAEWEARVEMRVSAFEDVPSVTEDGSPGTQ